MSLNDVLVKLPSIDAIRVANKTRILSRISLGEDDSPEGIEVLSTLQAGADIIVADYTRLYGFFQTTEELKDANMQWIRVIPDVNYSINSEFPIQITECNINFELQTFDGSSTESQQFVVQYKIYGFPATSKNQLKQMLVDLPVSIIQIQG